MILSCNFISATVEDKNTKEISNMRNEAHQPIIPIVLDLKKKKVISYEDIKEVNLTTSYWDDKDIKFLAIHPTTGEVFYKISLNRFSGSLLEETDRSAQKFRFKVYRSCNKSVQKF
jgi:beta-galactosidase beta subunit